MVEIITYKNFWERWKYIKPLVQRVVDRAAHGEFTTDQIGERIEKGYCFAAYAREEGEEQASVVLVWELACYPSMTAVNIVCLGGKDIVRNWARYGEMMKTIWRSQGATYVEGSVSPAMARLVQRVHLMDPVYVCLRGRI